MGLESIKRAFFEIFVAGFQDGYMGSVDVVTAYLIKNGVEIPVRCKDCKHYVLRACACRHENFNGIIHMNGFCSYGERKENER